MIKHVKVTFVALISLFGCFSLNAQKQSDTGRKQLIDFDWKFKLGDVANAAEVGFNDAGWRRLDLPHDWSIEGNIDRKNPMSGAGGYLPAGIGWYRKTFMVPAAWQGKRVSVYFEGVYMNAEVFINGKSLGIHPYGYTPFYFDLTPFLTSDEENTVAVRVDNAQQINCRWYSGSGIYRHVWLQVTEPVHVAQWGMAIMTEKADARQAIVQIKTTVKNETGREQKLTLKTAITSPLKRQIANEYSEVVLPPKAEKEVIQSVTVISPSLWSPESPTLYHATVQLVQQGKVMDVCREEFGIRTIDYSAEKGFLLNGKPIKLKGGCVHHDHGCLGAASFDKAEERKVRLLKQAGFNAVRTSHNPPSEAFLRSCDELGLLVIDEAFDGWRTEKNKYDYARFFDKWAKQDIQTMVMRDRNHPSVIMWSIGNEIIERTKTEAVETANRLSRYVKEMDAKRPVTSAMTTWNEGWAVFDPLMAVHDICGYNYQLQEAPDDHLRVPSRVIVQTESYPRDAFKNWKAVHNQLYVIGDFVWTALDYLGESGIGRWYYPGEPKGEHWEHDLFPWHGAYCGDIDLTGWRKPISHYRNILWNDTEKLYMAVREPNPDTENIGETLWSVWPTWESWTWPGYEGKPLDVEIYSKYPKIRLYLNNQLMAEKETNEETAYKAVIPVNYAAGELKVVGIGSNNQTETKILTSAAAPAIISLKADKRQLAADGQDLAYVTVELLDKKGTLNPNAENLLRFDVEGAGTIIGVDNANLRDTSSYVSLVRKAWHGRALAVVRTSRKPGLILLNVRTDGLPVKQIRLESK